MFAALGDLSGSTDGGDTSSDDGPPRSVDPASASSSSKKYAGERGDKIEAVPLPGNAGKAGRKANVKFKVELSRARHAKAKASGQICTGRQTDRQMGAPLTRQFLITQASTKRWRRFQ